MGKTEKEFVLVTDRGVLAHKSMDADDVLSKLLYAFLQLWNDELFKIDIGEAADRILEVIGECEEDDGDDDAEAILRYIFGDDNEEDTEDE